MSSIVATLGGSPLPYQFSYKRPVPVKRITMFKTAGAVVKQLAKEFVPADVLIEWSCDNMCYSEWKTLFDKYNDPDDTTYIFTGYQGDSFSVIMFAMDPATVKGGLYSTSGSFQIIDVTNWGE